MPNRLIHETSPYLLQHAHNPVAWYAWGDEPFERARRENKPVLVSIGYAACHWCHVMEHESFENEEVATYMNEHFINIKVDREEHPDVDHLYMDAVQAISGSGGWPLNTFVTPDRIPFYGGTYFPPRPAYGRSSWLQVLQRINEIWTEQADEVATQSSQMLQYLQNASRVAIVGKVENWDESTCNTMAENLLKQADTRYGGFGRAPKFPGTMAINYLLEHYRYTGDQQSLQQALLSLDAMIEGGIYDQLGGGFARYATDDKWLVPHFEKMLYDNALILLSVCEAYKITKSERYATVIHETIAFVERELKDASGLYYSALDADSEGVEGKYYTWLWDEWQDIVQNDEILTLYFGVSQNGNWEHTNILHVAAGISGIAQQIGMSEDAVSNHISVFKKRLLEARNTRVRPLTDDKCLLSWNALMNRALSCAAATLNSALYAERAAEHMEAMVVAFQHDGRLKHTWKAGKARIDANLDDYAYLVQAMMQLASVSDNNRLILQAAAWLQQAMVDFSHEDEAFFYYSSAYRQDIPVRKVDNYDGATPSANAVMAHNLLLLGLCMENREYTERAYAMLLRTSGMATRYTTSFGYWATLLQRYTRGMKTIVCTGGQAPELLQHSIPEGYIITSKKEISEIPMLKHKISWSENTVFICTQDACMPPMAYPAQVLSYLYS